MGAVAGSAMAPPPQPDKLWENLDLTLSRRGNLWVTAHVESGTLLCADNAPCSVDLGLYVDDQPVAHTDRVLSSDCTGTGCRIDVSEEDLFGIATGRATGSHHVQLCSRTRSGTITDYVTE